MKLVISKTPLRVSLFGGGTDLKSFYKLYGGAVLSFTINKFLYVIVKKNAKVVDFKYRINWSKTEFANKIDDIEHPIVRETFRLFKIDFPIEVSTFSDIPANTGLGSSSAFAVGLINSLSRLLNLNYSSKKIAELASKIEVDILKRNIGKQDHYASAYGGMNKIEFNKTGKVKVSKFNLDNNKKKKLNDSFLIFFLNKQRDASKILNNQKNLKKKNVESLKQMKKIVFKAEKIIKIKKNLIPNFGKLLSENWYWKKRNNYNVSYDVVDKIYEKGIKAGAYGGKLLGAGGGGYFLFISDNKAKNKIKNKIKKFSTINIDIYNKGTHIIYDTKEKNH